MDANTTDAPAPLAHTEMVRLMLLARGLERRAAQARMGPGSGRAGTRGRGGEAVAVGAASALGPYDRLFAPDRYLAAHLTRGLTPEDYLLRCLGGVPEGPPGDAAGIGYASPGDELADLAAGAAVALQLRQVRGVAMVIVPGATLTAGRCEGALAAARSRGLPLAVIVEGEVPMPDGALEVDSGRVALVAGAAREAVAAARDGNPSILICHDEPDGDAPDHEHDPIRRELYRMAACARARELVLPLREEVEARIGRAGANALARASHADRREAAA